MRDFVNHVNTPKQTRMHLADLFAHPYAGNPRWTDLYGRNVPTGRPRIDPKLHSGLNRRDREHYGWTTYLHVGRADA